MKARKVAVTVRLESMVTAQVFPSTESQPVQVERVAPYSAVAVSMMTVPWGKDALHVPPQSIDEGELVIVPRPVPDLWMVRSLYTISKVAVTVRLESMVTAQVFPSTESQPVQVERVAPYSAVAVSMMTVPWGKDALHVPPQSIDEGELVIVPRPVPDL